jgi:hypothetical protein
MSPLCAVASATATAPAVIDEQRHSAVVALIGRGLDLQPGDPRGIAWDMADALGLPVRRPARPRRQSPLTGRHRPFERLRGPRRRGTECTTPSVSVTRQSEEDR